MIKINSIEQFEKEFGTYENLLKVNEDDAPDTGLVCCSKEIFEKITDKEIDNEIDDGTSEVRCINCGSIFFEETAMVIRSFTFTEEDDYSIIDYVNTDEKKDVHYYTCSNCKVHI